MDIQSDVSFDLMALSERALVDLRSSRRWDWVTLIGGAAVCVAGIAAIPLTESRPGSYWIAAIVLAATGAFVAGIAWYQLRYWLNYPAILTVGPKGILLSGSASETKFATRSLDWTDPRIRFNLIDRRGMPMVGPDGQPIARFSVMTNSQVSIDIPQVAFESILEASKAHGLDVRGVTVPFAMAGGSYVRYTVRHARRSSRPR